MFNRPGTMWHNFLSLAMFTYNIFHGPNLGSYSPYELVFGRKPKLLINVETNLDIKIADTFKDYHTLLTKRLDYLQKMLQNFKMKHLALLNKDRVYPIQQWRFGLFNFSPNTQLQTSLRKLVSIM